MMLYRRRRPDETAAVLDLVAHVFDDNPFARDSQVRADVAVEPDFGPASSLVAVDTLGRLRGHLAHKPLGVTLAGKRLPVGRFGSVCVHPDERRRGIGARLLQLAELACGEVAAYILNPAQDAYVQRFYEAQGYVAASRTRSQVQLDPVRLSALPAPPTRAATAADQAALEQLYERHYGPQAGSVRRAASWWQARLAGRRLLWSPPLRWEVCDGPQGPLAYAVRCDGDQQQVWEWAAAPAAPEAALAVLAGITWNAPDPVLHIAPDDPLWALAAPLVTADITPPPDPVMLKAARLELLRPLLQGILHAAGAELDGDAAGATVRGEGVVLRLSWSHLLALVYDGRPLERWVAAGLVGCQPAGSAALAVAAGWLPLRASTRRATDAW
ncbi:MAG: GNAT family N-acetyltransferase [Fimbriimonadaceae bacterium]|nr:GNAT family N-acetyltransferase [Fimbriimonadaceae bacterium]